MKIKLNIQAVTLIELIVTTVVVGIIMIGVMSADNALRRQTDVSNKGGLAALNGTAILAHIIHNASLAIGRSSDDPGIIITDKDAILTGNHKKLKNNTFCIRNAMSVADGGPDAATNWQCYSHEGLYLYTCTFTDRTQFNPSFKCNGSTSTTTILNLGELYDNNGSVTVAEEKVDDVANSIYVEWPQNSAVGSQEQYFEVTIYVADPSSYGGVRKMSQGVSSPRHIF